MSPTDNLVLGENIRNFLKLIFPKFSGIPIPKDKVGSMQEISKLIKIPEIMGKKKTSERSELVGYFHERLTNKKGQKFRVQFIAMKLAHLKVPDLYYLQSICKQAKNFGSCFWGSLKT